MTTPLIVIPCKHCEGIGTLPGPKTGKMLRREREERGVSFPQLKVHFPYSNGYLSDLENGNRPFSNKLVAEYRTAIEAAIAERLAKGD